jgi:hypothetical protein
MRSTHVRRSVHGLVALAATAGLAIAWSARAQAPAATAAPDPTAGLTAEQIRQDIELFGWLYRLQLTPAQATPWAEAARLVAQAKERWDEENAHPLVREALLAMRAAAAEGRPIDDGLRSKLDEARRAATGAGDGPLGEDAVYQAARAAAEQVLPALSPEQRVYLAVPWAQDRAEDLLEQLRRAREEDREAFTAWRDEVADDLARDRGERGPAIATALRALLDEARGLTPDAFHQQRPMLLGRLHELLVGELSNQDRDEGAAERLTEFGREFAARLAPCLEEYARAHGG